jgi:hypothetical protein
MSDLPEAPSERPKRPSGPGEGPPAPDRASLPLLFGAAAVALTVVLGLVALVAYVAFRP